MGIMENDFAAWLEQFRGHGFDLHQKHLNPAFVKMLRAIGFDNGNTFAAKGRISGTKREINISICSPAGASSPWAEITRKSNRFSSNCWTWTGQTWSGWIAAFFPVLAAQALVRHVPRRTVAGFLHQQRHRNRRGRPEIRPLRHRPAGHHLCDHAFHGLTAGSLSVNGDQFLPRTLRRSDARRTQDSV